MKRKTKLTPDQQIEFEADKQAREWWSRDGCYIDPDTDDVDWFDKRMELAQMAYIAGFKAARQAFRCVCTKYRPVDLHGCRDVSSAGDKRVE